VPTTEIDGFGFRMVSGNRPSRLIRVYAHTRAYEGPTAVSRNYPKPETWAACRNQLEVLGWLMQIAGSLRGWTKTYEHKQH
jgi:hypothetical protein